ncbi:hypothetical protein GPECTOR_50g582 [Gonium pectorale]|uniref:DUF1365 domain-containing protein n=1 Tax=Gonium pectorale TaxID=33097 RepID=A0A150G7E7_GONPE|nr:hypothetical protein GPECTOR_50g582 [Gonium pectorale]|eukprot:KXZ45789.1 hypothetical protein GPECTOR_50g582 [Gonium pectorale]
MTADEARKFASTAGPVKLLTDPMSVGYVQNPISVYYCYGPAEKGATPRLERCIAEVTNTPWGERVSFVFDPEGQSVRKALHVSPFMDMQNTWHLKAPEPAERLKLVVRASHPVHGDYFYADMVGRISDDPRRNEEAGLGRLLRYGFMPHRVAVLIYWQAVKLLFKGVRFHPPPSKEYQRQLVAEEPAADPPAKGTTAAKGAAAKGAATKRQAAKASGEAKEAAGLCPVAGAVWGAAQHSHPRNGLNGKHFLWKQAAGWPWREE